MYNLSKDIPEGEGIDWNVIIVDATEISIQRPKKQKKSYSGKKKAQTFKVQVLMYYKTQQILSLYMSKSAVHNFKLFKCDLHLNP